MARHHPPRNALITGASRGIGRAIAHLLHQSGHKVALCARSEPALSSLRDALGPARAAAIPIDLRDSAAGSRAVELAEAALQGPLHIVVHAAAPFFPMQRIMQVSDEDVTAQLGTAVPALSGLCRAAIPSMLGERFGRVVVLSSLAASTGAAGSALYSAAKAGMEGMIRSLALDHGRHGITCNAVEIGFCDTERFRARTDETTRARNAQATALRRIPSPEEVAEIVGFLCRPEAGIITGSVLQATAGSHLNTLW